MKRTIYIKLKKVSMIRSHNFPETGPGVYSVESIKNAAQICVGSKSFRVGDMVTVEQADRLCDDLSYEVTVGA